MEYSFSPEFCTSTSAWVPAEIRQALLPRIFRSGSRLAGDSVDYREKGFRGIKDFRMLTEDFERRRKDDQI